MAADVVQEVFMSVWKNKDNIKITSSIEGYLTRSTVNKAINFLEKNKKHLKVELNDQTEFKHDHQQQTDHHFDYELFQSEVYDALEELPPKCRTIFKLSRFEDMKYKEIAEHLNISVKTVENQMSIAISRINNEIKPRLKKNFPDLFLSLFLIFFQIF